MFLISFCSPSSTDHDLQDSHWHYDMQP